MEGGGSAAVPHELIGVGGSAAMPEVSVERDGSIAVPSKITEVIPSTWEQGAGSKRPRPDEVEQGARGSSPKCRLIAPT